jgi:hypothetical protein
MNTTPAPAANTTARWTSALYSALPSTPQYLASRARSFANSLLYAVHQPNTSSSTHRSLSSIFQCRADCRTYRAADGTHR